jgi:uncharacterized protein YegL
VVSHVKIDPAPPQPIVFFLTDGHPTVGETDSTVILDNVLKANVDSMAAAIFSLAFGRQADFQMLKLLSLQNNAFARKIYVAADASLQLEGFYKEVGIQCVCVSTSIAALFFKNKIAYKAVIESRVRKVVHAFLSAGNTFSNTDIEVLE